jgi:prepilin-type N-terminal cleavage/methylation domain-containing protein
MKRAFTLIELVVAVAILAIMASFAGAVFKVGIESYRVSGANAEIMRNLRAITDQLNADFKGLRKDGEIFVAWSASPIYDSNGKIVGYERFDRIMFFANGDFHTYRRWPPDAPGANIVRGNVARISYMLASRAGNPWIRPQDQLRHERILARTQHVLTADPTLTAVPLDDPMLPPERGRIYSAFWHNTREYDANSLEQWLQKPWWPAKARRLTAVSDIIVDDRVPQAYRIGTIVRHPTDPCSVHKLLCQGVGEFMVQGWLEDMEDMEDKQRWFPQTSYDGGPVLVGNNTDFILDGKGEPDRPMWVLYPFIPDPDIPDPGIPDPGRGREDSMISIGDGFGDERPDGDLRGLATEENFNRMPGLGRALKFTFTLYDSRGIIEGGRTFTHIVYLDD